MGISFTGKKEERPLIQEGKYEVTLNSDWANTAAGDPYIKLTYKIRTDVTQDEGGRLIFDGIYKSKTTGQFNSSKINAILSAIPNAKLDFDSYDELIQYLNDVNMIVEIVTEKADASNALQKDRSVVKFWSNEPSAVGPTFFQKGPVEDTTVTSTSELPF